MTTSSRVFALLVLVASFIGCSKEPTGPNPGIIHEDPPDEDAGADASLDVGDSGGSADAAPDGTQPDLGPAPEDTGPEDTGPDAEPDVCIPETDVEMCLRYGFECGPLQDLDNCGVSREIASCGDESTVCMNFDTCGGSGVPGTCGCTIATCGELGVLCGEVADTCGGNLNCNLFCVDEVSAGGSHGCMIGSGKLKCWGRNGDGQLGTGDTTQQKNPADVVGFTSSVAHVATGVHNTCAIDSAGRVLCWGDNARGQLGVGTTVDSKQPTAPAIFAGADQIAVGEFHACARSADKVECWGSNDYGQIGNAAFNIGSNVGVPTVPDGLGSGVVAVTAGHNHNCVLQNDTAAGLTNVLKCWGRNHLGQVGTLEPNSTDVGDDDGLAGFTYTTVPGWDLSTLVAAPVAVADPENPAVAWSGLKAVAAGKTHTCAIDSTDRMWCWGIMPGFDPPVSCPRPDNKSPSLCSVFPRNTGIFVARGGTDPTPSSYEAIWVANKPVLVDLGGKTPTELAAGEDHHCVLIANPDPGESNIQCLGRNGFGQVGDGTNNNWPTLRTVFLDVSGNPVVATHVDLGDKHSCALVGDSNVKCWGSNAEGQIGNSSLLRDESYRPYDVRLAP